VLSVKPLSLTPSSTRLSINQVVVAPAVLPWKRYIADGERRLGDWLSHIEGLLAYTGLGDVWGRRGTARTRAVSGCLRGRTRMHMLCRVCGLGVTPRLGFMGRHVPSCARNETSEAFDTLVLVYGCYLSIACTVLSDRQASVSGQGSH
jgi:hypothetical protein